MAYDRKGRTVAAKADEAMTGTTGPVAARKRSRPPEGRAASPNAAASRSSKKLIDRIKLLPVLMFVAVLLLSVKINDLWKDVRGFRATVTVATVAEAGPSKSGGTAAPSGSGPTTAGQLAQAADDKNVDAKKPEKPLDPVLFTRSEIELLQELSKRRKELDAREDAVIQKEGLLAAAEDRLEKKIVELQDVRGEIEALIEKYDEQEEKQLNELVQIYAKMKPKDSARIFNELDMDVLLQVFSRMKAGKTAPILANMRPARAKEITVRIAERKTMPKIN